MSLRSLPTNTSFSSQRQAATVSRGRDRYLQVLGLSEEASTSQIDWAYTHLVADITPSQGANHSRVGFAKKLLEEVEEAYSVLKAS